MVVANGGVGTSEIRSLRHGPSYRILDGGIFLRPFDDYALRARTG